MDPGLDPNGLANNGGPTLTIKLLTTSAGHHTGNPNSNGTVDQRGYVRPNPLKNLPVSMGAYDPDAKPKQLGLLQPPATDTELTADADPAAPGQPVTLTATLFPADDGTPTGPVEFMDGDAVLATVDLSVVDGVSQAAFTTSDLALGVDTITAVYGGDDSEAGSTSSPLTLTVQQTPTWVGVVSSADPQWPDEPVTFTADVVGDDGGSPTGTVTFMAGDTVLGTATLSSQDGYSQATFTVSALPLGSYDITAVYGGDDTYAPASSDTLTQIVGYATSTYLTSSADPSSPGQAVTFTAYVSSDGGPSPTGTTDFYDCGTLLGSGAVVNGVATFTTSDLSLGRHCIVAFFTGDDANVASVSDTLTQTVQLYPTSVNLESSNSESSPGQAVTFTAYISSDGGPSPTGTVSFYDGTTLIGTAAVAYGEATLTTSSLAVGTHSITAVYGGDAANESSTSYPLTQTVQLAASTTYLSGPGSSSPGQSVTFTASVSVDGEATLTGTVSFYDGSTLLGTVTLVNNAASFTTSSLSLGSHTITAVYSGDDDFSGSTSGGLTLTVQMAPTSTYLESSSQTASAGTPVTFTAYIYSDSEGGPTPTGTVSFYDGLTLIGTGTVVNGVATFTTSSLSVGDHTITAVYSGDDANDGSTSQSLDQTIQ